MCVAARDNMVILVVCELLDRDSLNALSQCLSSFTEGLCSLGHAFCIPAVYNQLNLHFLCRASRLSRVERMGPSQIFPWHACYPVHVGSILDSPGMCHIFSVVPMYISFSRSTFLSIFRQSQFIKPWLLLQAAVMLVNCCWLF